MRKFPVFYKYFTVTMCGSKTFYLDLAKTSTAERKFLHEICKKYRHMEMETTCMYDIERNLKNEGPNRIILEGEEGPYQASNDIKSLLYQEVDIDKTKKTCLLKTQKEGLRNWITKGLPREGFLLMIPWIDWYNRGEEMLARNIYKNMYLSFYTGYFFFHSIEEIKEIRLRVGFETTFVELLPERDLNIIRLLITLSSHKGDHSSIYEEINNLLTLFTIERITPSKFNEEMERRSSPKANKRSRGIMIGLGHHHLGTMGMGDDNPNEPGIIRAPDIIPPSLEEV